MQSGPRTLSGACTGLKLLHVGFRSPDSKAVCRQGKQVCSHLIPIKVTHDEDRCRLERYEMPQDQCQCPSGSHGHAPGECKNAMTHEEDHMCDYCHEKAVDLLAMLPPGK